MHVQDAEILLIRYVRERPRTTYPNFGYDVYVPNVNPVASRADRASRLFRA